MKIGPMIIFALVCTAVAPAAVMAQQVLAQQVLAQQVLAQDWKNTQSPGYQQQQQEQQDACMNDAMTICGQFVPDRDRVAACLLSNRHRVSQPCRIMLSHWHG